MRILGIDPGLRFTGWGIIDYVGATPKHIANGTIKTNSKIAMAARLAEIMRQMQDLIKTWSPATVAIEETFMNNNAGTALKLGQARGVAMTVPAMVGLNVYEYAPNLIKKSVVGAGHANKDQIQMMLKVLMPNVEFDSEHAADSLAIAMCHAHHMPALKQKNEMVEV